MITARERKSWPMLQPTLTDGVIEIRPWNATDVDWVFNACQDSEIQRWTRVPVPYEQKHAEGFVVTISPENWKNERGADFAVVDTKTGKGIGAVGVCGGDVASGVGEAGYWTSAEARGKGVTARALKLLTDWALEEGGYIRLELQIEVENLKSRAVAEKSGYKFESVMPKKVWRFGAHRDVAIYVLLA